MPGFGHQLEPRQRRVVVAAGQLHPGDVDAGIELGGGQRRQLPHLRIAPVAADNEIAVQPPPFAALGVPDPDDAAPVVAQQLGDPRPHPHVQPVGPAPLDHPRQEPGLRHERVERELRARAAVVGEHVALLGRAPDERVACTCGISASRARPARAGRGGRARAGARESPRNRRSKSPRDSSERHGHPRPGQEVAQHHPTRATARDHTGRSVIHNLDDRDICRFPRTVASAVRRGRRKRRAWPSRRLRTRTSRASRPPRARRPRGLRAPARRGCARGPPAGSGR